MKIFYITSGKIPSKAANSVHVMKMCQAFANLGNDVKLAFQEGKGSKGFDFYSSYGVQPIFKAFCVPAIPFIGRFVFAVLSSLHALTGAFDLVFSRCLPSALFCIALGKKVILEMHEPPSVLTRHSKLFFTLIIKNKNLIGIIVISKALKDIFINECFYDPNKILVLHDGADVPQNLENKNFDIHRSYKFHAGYTGHLYKGRGIEVIIDLAKEFPEILFHIIGGNDDECQEWRDRTSFIRNILFYGHISHGEIASYLDSFDVLLAPYQRKVAVYGNKGDTSAWMSPLKIFEYMASGTPMICSDMPVLREVLEHNRSAILCTPDDISEWCVALRDLIDNPEHAKEIGDQAKEEFLLRYTWQARAESIIKFLNTIRPPKFLQKT